MKIDLETMASTTLTIGLPTFNSESFLRERIRSIQSQTNSDFVVNVIDGGSTDRTLDLIDDWSLSDCRVHRDDRTVQGLYPAFNAILDRAETEFVCILPADDLMPANWVSEMVAVLQRYPNASAVACPLRLFDRSEMVFADGSIPRLHHH